jgi:hypothetical protein
VVLSLVGVAPITVGMLAIFSLAVLKAKQASV